MRLLSYRTKRQLKKGLLIAAVVLLCLLLLFYCVYVFLGRYVVYTKDGAKIDFDWRSGFQTTQKTVPDDFNATVQIVNETDEDAIGATHLLTGYYVTRDMLYHIDQVSEAVSQKEDLTTCLFDVKNRAGFYYYDSAIPGVTEADIDFAAMDELLSTLKGKNVYLIARISALSDWNYCLSHEALGMEKENGALWSDENSCYFLDPAKADAIAYIEQICMELQQKGFQEVVLDGFYYPDDTAIATDGDRDTIIREAAQQIYADMTALDLKISFGVPAGTSFAGFLSEGSVYVDLNDGGSVPDTVSALKNSVDNPNAQIVFVTESHDTRFSYYGTLLPILESDTLPDDTAG